MKGIVTLLVLFVFLIILGGALVLGYLGFMPGLSSLFGSDRPRNLGVTYSALDTKNADDKRSVKFVPLSPGSSQTLLFSGQKSGKVALTSSEITALVNRWAETWRYSPLSQAQVKIGGDGTVELSALFRADRLAGYLAAKGYSAEQTQQVLQALPIRSINPPIYFKGMVSVTDNKLTLGVDQMVIGRVSVPKSIFIEKKNQIIAALEEDQLNRIPGLFARSVTFGDGNMIFEGDYPAVEQAAQ